MNDIKNLKEYLRDLVMIIQSPKALKLATELREFSPFDVLKINHYEIRNVNTLSWLLDPNQNHGLGESFLRVFLKKFAHENSNEHEDHSIPELFETSDDRTVVVRREVKKRHLNNELVIENKPESDVQGTTTRNGSLDLLIYGETWAVAIEAKINSGEGEKQLENYESMLKTWNKQKKRKLIQLFLVVDPDSDPPSQSDWVAASWSENVIYPLLEVMDGLVAENGTLSPQIQFIKSYIRNLQLYATADEGTIARLVGEISEDFDNKLTSLKSNLRRMQPQSVQSSDVGNEIEKLKQKIYHLYIRHKDLLDRILASVDSGTTKRANKLKSSLEEFDYTTIGTTSSWISFLPKTWLNEPTYKSLLLKSGKELQMGFVLGNRPDKLTLSLQIKDLGDHATDANALLRRDVIRRIQNDGTLIHYFPGAFFRAAINCDPKARPIADVFFSILTMRAPVNRDQDADDILRKWLYELKNNKVLEKFWEIITESMKHLAQPHSDQLR